MKLNTNTGELYLDGNNINPPQILSAQWENLLKLIFPKLKLTSHDYHQWDLKGFSIYSLKVFNYYELNIHISYSQNMELDKAYKFTGFLIYFTDDFLNNEVFKEDKLLYHQKLKRVKEKFLELLESMTNQKLRIGKRNSIPFSPWGNALISRKKGEFYELSIYWNYKS